MKEIGIILAASILVFSLTACGKGGEKTPEPTNNVNIEDKNEHVKTQQKQSNNDTKKDNSSVELTLTAKFPMFLLYIDGPNYHFIENGGTNLFNVGGNRFIALTSSKYVKADKPSEILDAYFNEFKTGVSANCRGYKPEKFDIKESKEIEINGINFWRFEGELIAKTPSLETSFYTVGYTFIWDGHPFQITGVVVSEGQEKEHIDEITRYVDEMVKTIRDKR
ncbi:hypothetical protein ABCY62_07235 [Acetivibrio clariflavus]|uniref:hypothetical protein n=1 Tax=Acetivibrio clariflavus TaxID=288965 RepID=UPI0031F483AF